MTKAPYIVYTPDEDFVLKKEDVNSGGGSGGDTKNDIFLVKFSYSEETGDIGVCDKTFEEINEAYKQNKFIRACLEIDVYDENDEPSKEPQFYLYLDSKKEVFIEGDITTFVTKICFIFANSYYEFDNYVEPDDNLALKVTQVLIAEDNTIYTNYGTYYLSTTY